jgi:hypothetical protein
MNSTSISISSATTLEITPAVAGKVFYSCGFYGSIAAAQTISLITGTKTTTGCDTNPVTHIPALAFTGATNGPVAILPSTTNSFQSLSGGDACIVTTTTGAVSGYFLWQQF